VEAARRATGADRDVVVALVETAVAELAPTRGGALWRARNFRAPPYAASIDAALAADDHLVVVGSIDGAVFGYGIAAIEPLRDGRRLAVVEDIYVEPAARGVGVGAAVMDLLLAWSQEQGCIGIDAMALPGNRDTKNFFERYGLTARAIIVHRSFAQP